MIAAAPVKHPLTPAEIVRVVKHLPAAPRVLPKLKRLLSDGNSEPRAIAALVRVDPGLAARVLQTANSAYYGAGTRCGTIEEAVTRVGYAQIYELVAGAVASQVLVRPLEVYACEADEMWRRSVTCALAADVLARQVGVDHDLAYTAGLLHGVGMVAIDEWAMRAGVRLVLASAGWPRETMEAERAAFGLTHAQAGATLLEEWGFPAAVCEPVRWQYAPGAAFGHAAGAALLVAARWLRTAVCSSETRPPLPESAQLAAARLSPALLPRLVAEVSARMAKISLLLEVQAEPPRCSPHGPACLFEDGP